MTGAVGGRIDKMWQLGHICQSDEKHLSICSAFLSYNNNVPVKMWHVVVHLSIRQLWGDTFVKMWYVGVHLSRLEYICHSVKCGAMQHYSTLLYLLYCMYPQNEVSYCHKTAGSDSLGMWGGIYCYYCIKCDAVGLHIPVHKWRLVRCTLGPCTNKEGVRIPGTIAICQTYMRCVWNQMHRAVYLQNGTNWRGFVNIKYVEKAIVSQTSAIG